MKKMYVILLIMVLAALVRPAGADAQIVTVANERINTDSVRREFDKGPYFGLYKDNYFIFGPTIGQKITRENTNAKFQVSIAQKLTKSTLPWNTYLYLFYTQKVFWNVLEESLPMTDLNFNPGIGIAKPLFVKNRYIGKLTFQIEHESNGRDSIQSRSWNRITFGANIIVDANLSVHGKVWIPIIDGQNNKDILDYCGIYQVGTSYLSNSKRWAASLVLVKRRGFNLNYNTIFELGWKLSNNSNQYLFLQYYNGYGEGLLDYNKFHSQLRVGICIKPVLFSDY
ncbi:MAG: phospholipase A [Barnesiella sp.]|nr:phospholipase A [Barnesiella sp.]MBD5257138.1 phospholipase A [Barnesiella sp.]